MSVSFKNKKLLVLGTSHCLDLNGEYDLSNEGKYNTYIDTSWPGYLCDKLGVTFINGSITSYGIETYPARVFSHLQRNYNITHALIEYPGLQRYVQSVSKQTIEEKNILDTDFWRETRYKGQEYRKSKSKKLLLEYNPAYLDNNDKAGKLTIQEKLDYVNPGADFHITEKELYTLLGLMPKHSVEWLKMNAMMTAVMLDTLLKSRNIQPIWFAFQSSWPLKWRNTIMKDMEVVNDITDGIPFREYIEKELGITHNKKFYSDGYHLHSKQWRDIIVDKYLFPVLNNIINPE